MEDLPLLLPEALGHIALPANGRLAPRIVGRHQVEVGLRDLDVVPEIVREPDLQAADSRALLLAPLQVREPRLVAAHELARAVQLTIIAGPHEVSLGDVGRRLVRESSSEKLPQIRELVDAPSHRGRLRAQFRERGPDLGKQREGVANAAELPRVAQAVLEPAEDPRYIAHPAELAGELREQRGLSGEFTDDLVPPADLRGIEDGRREPPLEEAGAGGGGGAVHRGEEGSLAAPAHRREDLQVAQGGGVEKERLRAPVLPEAAQVLGLRAQVVRRVEDEGACGTEPGVVARQAEALEVQDADRLGDDARPRRCLKAVPRKFGERSPRDEPMQRVHRGLIVRGGLPAFDLALGDQDLRRVERSEDGQKVLDPGGGRHLEFPGRELRPRGVEAVLSKGNRAQVPVVRGLELVCRERCAGAQDAGQLAPDQLARLGGLVLVADRDLLSRGEELPDVGVRRVVGEARHGVLLPLGQREAEDARGDDRVVEEELVEIAQAEQEEGVPRQPAPHLEVLPHHRGHFLGLGHSPLVEWLVIENSMLERPGVSPRWTASPMPPEPIQPTLPLFHRDFGGQGTPPIVILHGMLGSSRNWQTVGADLAASRRVYALDLRNHGMSPHSEAMSYGAMAQDVRAWMDSHAVGPAEFIGHSMGGKVAMLLACRSPERVSRLVVVDIAPREYRGAAHRSEFAAMQELDLADLKTRAEAEMRMEGRVPDWAMRKFITTNLERVPQGGWRWQVNLPALVASLPQLERNPLAPGDRFDGTALFVAGGKSSYVRPQDHAAILRHFPGARIEVLPNSGHNPHIDGRAAFVAAVA